jgi:xanthine dehydrogenase YagS FAD-binding subunit
MTKFTYTEASDTAAAINEMQAGAHTKLIAGGTNLLDLMKINVETPNRLIDINHLPYNRIEDLPNGGLRLGALVTNAETAYNEQVRTRYPLLSDAILAGASPQLRNMATNGGNMLQRTRCYYFYDTATPCNKREPGTGCSAINGFNRIHAILGQSEHCIATHPSDMAVALAALDALVNVEGVSGERQIAFKDFHRLPGDHPEKDTNLEAGDLITSIDLPPEVFNANYKYVKVRDRASYAFALISVAVGLQIENDMIKDVRIAMGGVAHKPWRDTVAEDELKNKAATRENFISAAERILSNAKGYEHNEFKINLGKKAIVRALEEAAAMGDIR